MSIHQEIHFKCSARRIFDALTKAEQFAELTGAPAEIDAKSGGTFSCFGGMITGVSIEINPNRRLVQAWKNRVRLGLLAFTLYSLLISLVLTRFWWNPLWFGKPREWSDYSTKANT